MLSISYILTILISSIAAIESACTPSMLQNMTSSAVSSNNTILQNLQALADVGGCSNYSVTYINLLLALNSSCTSDISEQLNSTDGNYTFFAPSDSAFKLLPGFPDFGSSFCGLCNETSTMESQDQCPVGCNSTSVGFNATSAELMPCLSEVLQYHLLNESISFNETRFGFMNRSSYNFTVLSTELNSSCLVNLNNSTSSTNGTGNYQVLVFNVTNSENNSSSSIGGGNGGNYSSSSSSSMYSSPYNVTILHGINKAANVSVFDIQSSNGILHIVDALLIPPANFSQTVNHTYSSHSLNVNGTMGSITKQTTLPSFLNETDLESIANMTGITVFLPDPLTFAENSNSSSISNDTLSSFNLTNYVFPSILYNNRSFVSIGNLSEGVFVPQNLTNMNGENVTILFGRNNAMIVNGSRVTESNILMNNGVMHLLNASDLLPPSSSSVNETSSSSSGVLSRILNRIF